MNFKFALAAVAALGVAGTAEAADLAKKAPAAANYVKVCDAYGAGFFYIPGSDTCLKIGGSVRFQAQVNGPSSDWLSSHSASSSWRRNGNGISTLARGDITIDARSNTELGLLRSFIEVVGDNQSYGTVSTTAGVTNYNTSVYIDKAFIQFAGLTAGRAQSFWDFVTYGSYTLSSTTGPTPDARVNLLAYTFSFGNGISATLSVEDPSTSANPNPGATTAPNRRLPYDATAGNGKYAGVHTPDLVANVNVTQAWGSAQLSGLLHSDDSSIDGVDGKLGWGVLAGVKINLPMLAAGDSIAFQAAYSEGALGYVANGYQGGTAAKAYDFYTNAAGTGIDLAKGYSIYGALTHNWTKTVYTALGVGYVAYDAPDSAAAVSSDFNYLDVRATLGWKPVTNLLIAAEVEYGRVDYQTNTAAAVDGDQFTGLLRVQRSF